MVAVLLKMDGAKLLFITNEFLDEDAQNTSIIK